MTQSILLSVIVAGVALVAALAVAVLLLRGRKAATERVQALFRKPGKPARTAGSGHYYKHYWS